MEMQMWIAKAEYDESGPSIVHRKCFQMLQGGLVEDTVFSFGDTSATCNG